MTIQETDNDELLFSVIEGHIGLITLNRPAKRNAINGNIASRMEALVKQTEADGAIRAVILTSAHETVFCAGADLAEIAAGRGAALSTRFGGFAGLTDAPRVKPWIAAVSGMALAGGCELVLACDIVIASVEAQFGVPEVKRGLFAAAGGVHRLARVLPRNIALELVATGDPLPAERAYALGLVNHLVAKDAVVSTAVDLAMKIAGNAPLSVRESLNIARLAGERSDGELRELSRRAFDITSSSEDAVEGPRAFLEKRAPVWKGQ
jgi:enoyl-CoA hydratase/carnithine racemase